MHSINMTHLEQMFMHH